MSMSTIIYFELNFQMRFVLILIQDSTFLNSNELFVQCLLQHLQKNYIYITMLYIIKCKITIAIPQNNAMSLYNYLDTTLF